MALVFPFLRDTDLEFDYNWEVVRLYCNVPVTVNLAENRLPLTTRQNVVQLGKYLKRDRVFRVGSQIVVRGLLFWRPLEIRICNEKASPIKKRLK